MPGNLINHFVLEGPVKIVSHMVQLMAFSNIQLGEISDVCHQAREFVGLGIAFAAKARGSVDIDWT